VVRSEQFSAVGRWFHHFPRVWLEVADARATAEVLARAGVSTLADPFEVATGWTVEIANPWDGWTAAWPSLWYPSWPELRHLSIPSKAGACVAFQRWLSSWPACCSPPGPSLAVLQAVRVDAMGAAAMEAICYLVIARIAVQGGPRRRAMNTTVVDLGVDVLDAWRRRDESGNCRGGSDRWKRGAVARRR
jgi:hypothetical protein